MIDPFKKIGAGFFSHPRSQGQRKAASRKEILKVAAEKVFCPLNHRPIKGACYGAVSPAAGFNSGWGKLGTGVVKLLERAITGQDAN